MRYLVVGAKSETFAQHPRNNDICYKEHFGERGEAGLPLRTYYGETFNRSTGKIEPLAPTRLIDRAGNSIYYSHDPTRMAPGSIPTLIQEGLNVSKRPLTGRYNYYDRK